MDDADELLAKMLREAGKRALAQWHPEQISNVHVLLDAAADNLVLICAVCHWRGKRMNGATVEQLLGDAAMHPCKA